MTRISAAAWDDFMLLHPEAHLLQTRAWGDLKSEFGWKTERFVAGEAGAQVLFRRLPLGFCLAYIPKGPVGDNWLSLWDEIDACCLRERAVFLIVEPYEWEPERMDLKKNLAGFVWKSATIQPHRTSIIDLTGTEDDWLERMKQKTRYNIRLAQKKGVCTRRSTDLSKFHAMMLTTGRRDDFGVHSLAYYQKAYDFFHASGNAELLEAVYNGISLAMLMVFARGKTAWYFYGASGDNERNRMPTYLLQFEAMRWAAARGCTEYDLWGIPDYDESELESKFSSRQNGLWGVYRFKRGFNGQVKRSVGAFEKVFSPALYRLITLRSRLMGLEG